MRNIRLLSYNECTRYFPNESDRQAQATAYAKTGGVAVSNGNSRWWLRTPGSGEHVAAFVWTTGRMGRGYVDNPDVMVRPSLWLDLNAYYN